MFLRLAAVFRATVGQDAYDAHASFGEERQHPTVEQVGCQIQSA